MDQSSVAAAIDPDAFYAALRSAGYNAFYGVPCSLLASLWPVLEDRSRGHDFLANVREDEAVAVAGGAWMAGAQPAVFMQNSGLGNSINAIASLSQIYELPCLIVTTWRGYEGKDAPEHLVMGAGMTKIFDAMGLRYEVLDSERFAEQLANAASDPAPRVLIVHKGQFSE